MSDEVAIWSSGAVATPPGDLVWASPQYPGLMLPAGLPVMAQAYVNHGRWVAYCPRPECNNAEQLQPMQWMFECSNCRLALPVDWPPNAGEIWYVLAFRPVPQTRNWYPRDHFKAVEAGIPHGETPDELREENRQHGVVD